MGNSIAVSRLISVCGNRRRERPYAELLFESALADRKWFGQPSVSSYWYRNGLSVWTRHVLIRLDIDGRHRRVYPSTVDEKAHFGRWRRVTKDREVV